MVELTEFYPELQGRPDSKVVLDMEARTPSIPYGYLSGVMLQASFSSVSKSESYIAGEYTVILADAAGSPIIITLPLASSSAGRFYIIKKIDSSGNRVTIQGNASDETVDGETSVILDAANQYVWVLSDGSVWYIIGGEYVGLESALKEQLSESNAILEEMKQALKRIELHQASMSDAPVLPEDGQE